MIDFVLSSNRLATMQDEPLLEIVGGKPNAGVAGYCRLLAGEAEAQLLGLDNIAAEFQHRVDVRDEHLVLLEDDDAKVVSELVGGEPTAAEVLATVEGFAYFDHVGDDVVDGNDSRDRHTGLQKFHWVFDDTGEGLSDDRVHWCSS